MTTTAKKAAKKVVAFDYTTIKSFEDACKALGLPPECLPDDPKIPEEFRKPIIAGLKLMIVYKAINNGWKPNWNKMNQWKYYPWFEVLSSGFGFSATFYDCGHSLTRVGSRLCTDTREKVLYIAEQFKAEYQDYFLYTE